MYSANLFFKFVSELDLRDSRSLIEDGGFLASPKRLIIIIIIRNQE